MINENLPAKDDDDLRALNQKKVIDGIHNLGEGIKEVGSLAKETKLPAKITIWLAVGIYGIMFLLIGAAVATMLMTSGIGGLLDNSDMNRYFICENDYYSDHIKTYADAKIFIEQFNGTCELRHYKVMDYGK